MWGTRRRTTLRGRTVPKTQKAFTFIELILVIVLVAVLFAIAGFRTGTFSFWREEGFIRKFAETIQFLHTQAVSDQSFYIMEFNFKKNSYRIGVLPDGGLSDDVVEALSSSVGTISLELTALLNPSIGEADSLVPPPSFPSLATPEPLPYGMVFKSIKTMRGSEDDTGIAYITFSPRGFSEFAVIHLEQSTGAPVTFLVNPFTGLVDIYREYKDFEWAYTNQDAKQQQANDP